ncbi:unnamed protein product, partial [Gulo gulo]
DFNGASGAPSPLAGEGTARGPGGDSVHVSSGGTGRLNLGRRDGGGRRGPRGKVRSG